MRSCSGVLEMTFPWEGKEVTFEQLADGLREKYPAPVWDIPPALVRDANNVAPFMVGAFKADYSPLSFATLDASPEANLQASVPWQLPPSPAKY